jgi:transcription elongation factor Elf1
MGKATCPYCGEENKKTNIIDEGHLSLEKMHKKGNTRNVYLCPECGEVFEGHQKNERLTKPVDIWFDRPFQYCRGNMETNIWYEED